MSQLSIKHFTTSGVARVASFGGGSKKSMARRRRGEMGVVRIRGTKGHGASRVTVELAKGRALLLCVNGQC